MTLHTLLLIILWSFVAVFSIGIIIIAYFFGRRSIKDDLHNALILVRIGHQIRGFKGTMKAIYKSSIRYSYDKNLLTLVPQKYGEVYHRQRRLIFLNKLGQLISSPFDNDERLTDNEREDVIYEALESHMATDAIKAIQGKKTFNFIIIAVVAFIIGAVAVFGFYQFQGVMKQNQQQTQSIQQQSQPTKTNQQQPIEVK